jgi:aminoglycoside phosphotransferase (APT) family kinase protein
MSGGHVDEFSGTVPVREAHRFDEQRLADWMSGHVAGFRGPLTVEQFSGGQSNPTYKLRTPGRTCVLRRKPPGPLVKGAHAIEREAQVQMALGAAGFPVPHVHGLCLDEAIIGSRFYVMDYIEGRIVWDATFPGVGRRDRPRYFDAMNETLARLHCIDYRAIGLEDYARPGNYVERQVARWSRQYLAETEAGRDPHMDRLLEWLPDNIPRNDDEVCVVHGDFRVDNLIFHPTEARVIAVLDWELSTLGHPLSDLAYHLLIYRLPPTLIAGLLGADLSVLNVPSEAEYVSAYCSRTRRSSIPDLEFYIAFNLFRFAAILQGIKGRVMRGTAVSARARDMAGALPLVARCAWEHAMSVK